MLMFSRIARLPQVRTVGFASSWSYTEDYSLQTDIHSVEIAVCDLTVDLARLTLTRHLPVIQIWLLNATFQFNIVVA